MKRHGNYAALNVHGGKTVDTEMERNVSNQP